MRKQYPRTDRGMTLVELLVVVAILGGVIVVLAATFVTVLRITPQTEYRIDDARSTRGLQTWLVRDVASTPPQDYDTTSRVGFVDASGSFASILPGDLCTSTGTHVLFMAWEDSGVSYRSQYTIESTSGSDFEIVRRVCGGDSTTVTVSSAVANSACASDPFADVTLFDTDADTVADQATAEFCFVSTQSDDGISDGSQSQEITLSVASRNGES